MWLSSALNEVKKLSCANDMSVNLKKCKELTVSFLRRIVSLPVLTINNAELDKVPCVFALNIHRVLKRADVQSDSLITIYIALIRSFLEYCCPVWSPSLPVYLSEKLELLQRRASGSKTFKKTLWTRFQAQLPRRPDKRKRPRPFAEEIQQVLDV